MNNNGIKWGPFTLRIPFIHINYYLQNFSGLVFQELPLSSCPVGMALGLTLNEAVAACFISSVL